MEFGICLFWMVPIFTGMYTTSMMLYKGISAVNVCHDSDVLSVRGIDLSTDMNKRLVVRTAAGLGLGDSSGNPNPNGTAAVYISKILRVGPLECVKGITPAPSNGIWNTGNCPNYGSYVFAGRVAIGNTTAYHSVFGNPTPAQPGGAYGNLDDNTICSNTAEQVSGFSSILVLNMDQYALISEVFADISNVDLFHILQNPVVYTRNFS